MATLKYEAIARAGTYKDRETGEEKTRFHKCGVVFESDKGMSLKLESLPIGFDGWLSLRAPRPKGDSGHAAKPAAPKSGEPFDDPVPF
jgi:hypothetical protein